MPGDDQQAISGLVQHSAIESSAPGKGSAITPQVSNVHTKSQSYLHEKLSLLNIHIHSSLLGSSCDA